MVPDHEAACHCVPSTCPLLTLTRKVSSLSVGTDPHLRYLLNGAVPRYIAPERCRVAVKGQPLNMPASLRRLCPYANLLKSRELKQIFDYVRPRFLIVDDELRGGSPDGRG